MFDKLLRKMGQIKEEVFDEANKHMDTLGREVRGGVSDAVTGKSSDVFSSVLGKVTGSLSLNAGYLVQTEKMANEKRAMELGISSRELMGLSTEEIASKYGLTVEEYHKKIAEEAKQYKTKNLIDSAKEVNSLAKNELEARKNQAQELNMTIEEFNELTLQEQADRLNISLDELLEKRSLKF